MSVGVWRVVKKRFARDAFSGEGARRFGGRWNAPGVAMVYTAQSLSLAAFELLVNLGSESLLSHYVAIQAWIPDTSVESLSETDLPRNWKTTAARTLLRKEGHAWIFNCRTVALRVPSAVIPGECNFLLNPAHPDFSRVEMGTPQPLRFDSRLARK